MKYDEFNRRAFLRKVAVAGSAVVGTTFLAACGSKEQDTSNGTPMAAAADCSDLSGLTEQEKGMRETLQYVEVTPFDDKDCLNCNFYTQEEGQACGACTLIKGPIAPKGYCASWVAKPA